MQRDARERLLRRLLGLSVILLLEVLVLVLLPRRHQERHDRASVTSVRVELPSPGGAPASAGSMLAEGGARDATGSLPAVPTSAPLSRSSAKASAAPAPAVSDAPRSTRARQAAPARPTPGAPVTAGADGKPAQRKAAASPAKAAPAATPNATTGKTSASTSGYYVQVGSFSSEQNASGVQRQLGRSGYTSRLNATAVRGRIWYRVQAGPFTTATAASHARERLAAQGHPGARVLPPGAP